MNSRKNIPSGNPNPRKPMQAYLFLRSLGRISLAASVAHLHRRRRCRAIKQAAYASMAHASSPGRTWSRAILSRLLRRRARPTPAHLSAAKLEPVRNHPDDGDGLRRLVPGGETMDFCTLLEETIDYVQSLRTQVKLMQAINDSMEVDRGEEH